MPNEIVGSRRFLEGLCGEKFGAFRLAIQLQERSNHQDIRGTIRFVLHRILRELIQALLKTDAGGFQVFTKRGNAQFGRLKLASRSSGHVQKLQYLFYVRFGFWRKELENGVPKIDTFASRLPIIGHRFAGI